MEGNVFIDLNLDRDELAEAYEFFDGVDREAQALIGEALDKRCILVGLSFTGVIVGVNNPFSRRGPIYLLNRIPYPKEAGD